MAFNILIAILPILIAYFSIIGLVFGNIDSSKTDEIRQFLNLVFANSSISNDIVKIILNKLSEESGLLAIIALLSALFGGSRLFVLLQNIFNKVYKVKNRPFINQNILAILFLLAFAFLFPVIIFIYTFSSLLGNKGISDYFHIYNVGSLYTITSFVITTILIFLFFEIIYTFLPNLKIKFKQNLKGSIFATLAIELFISIFPFYSNYFLGSYVGQLGFVIVLMTFLYYMGYILLLGAEINAYYNSHK